MDRVIHRKSILKRNHLLYLLLSISLVCTLYLFLAPINTAAKVSSKDIIIKEVVSEPFTESIIADGTVQPFKTVIIDALIGGKVVEKHVQDGKMVEQGEPILELENTDLRLDILNRETAVFELINNIQNTQNNLEQQKITRQQQLVDIQYQLTDAKRLFTLNKALFKDSVISYQEYLKAEQNHTYLIQKEKITDDAFYRDSLSSVTQIKQMNESLNRAKQNLSLMKEKLEDLIVRAPVSGQLSSFNSEIGQLIDKGENLGQIDVNDRYKVRVAIDEHYLAKVATGLKGTFDYNNFLHELQITKIFPTISANQFFTEMEFRGKMPEGLKRGQNVRVRLELSNTNEATLIPKGAFFQYTGGKWIFVLDPTGQYAIRRDIVIGRQSPSHFEVLQGLAPGEKVILSSYDSFIDNQSLEIK